MFLVTIKGQLYVLILENCFFLNYCICKMMTGSLKKQCERCNHRLSFLSQYGRSLQKIPMIKCDERSRLI